MSASQPVWVVVDESTMTMTVSSRVRFIDSVSMPWLEVLSASLNGWRVVHAINGY